MAKARVARVTVKRDWPVAVSANLRAMFYFVAFRDTTPELGSRAHPEAAWERELKVQEVILPFGDDRRMGRLTHHPEWLPRRRRGAALRPP
jgi:hypothetical protein